MPGSRPHGGDAKRTRWIRNPLSAIGHKAFPIVAVGSSAGGLEACSKLLDSMPRDNGMAFILVQHLDPSHHSMMAELLSAHTSMPVAQAADGVTIESGHVYVIPPGFYLAVDDHAVLRLSTPQARHGARLPFDFLLESMASRMGARAVCVVLSGTGADGSAGLKAVKAHGGLVIAQEPADAGYDGMPKSAIATGDVDLVLGASAIAEALVKHEAREAAPPKPEAPGVAASVRDLLPEITRIVRSKTSHDFALYKPGTIERRIERRIALISLRTPQAYLDRLRADAHEVDELARDLLIHVTGFFRDPVAFQALANDIIPDLLRGHDSARPLRVWVPGCSTGEEVYSLAMLFHEAIVAAKREIKLQIFASDIDADAVAAAREGLYPASIAGDVSAARLAAFFSREDETYRVLPFLRANIVFTIHDLLADPPFARLDFVACRNLLIYLGPDAQAQAISTFHFALREGGILFLGAAEAVGTGEDRFTVVSKAARIYRRVGGERPAHFNFPSGHPEAGKTRARPPSGVASTRQGAIAELCRRKVAELYGPAAVLINHKLECLHYQGATDRYLKVASGPPGQDLLAKARDGVRGPLRSAIQGALRDKARTLVNGGRIEADDASRFDVVVEPFAFERESLLLVCFVDRPAQARAAVGSEAAAQSPVVADLERELENTRLELRNAVQNLESSSEEQMAINEEAMSVNEEYQSTNEELLASKEELQSLNEELSALNSQLIETLDRQRTTADDLQNVLYSTDVATIFLDAKFKIRFFTPATKALFNVIPGDVGRPLSDLKSLADDDGLLGDAKTVFTEGRPMERETEADSGFWYLRRILPYRTLDNRVEGVVITFEDITERRFIAQSLAAAKRQADVASLAKSRFLAAASHDLRQPLQALTFLQARLAKRVTEEQSKKLVDQLDVALGAMTGMLNALLDINQIEVGAVIAKVAPYRVDDLLQRLSAELTEQAHAAGLELRVVSCGLSILTDSRLLEQMIRNLVANALKYTSRGRVLIGCRRRGDRLRIEIWDTGIGIPHGELEAIFNEYHQVDNPARQHAQGLGLGLSIVKSLGELLEHPVRVRSLPGKGSVFSVEAPLAKRPAAEAARAPAPTPEPTPAPTPARKVLIVDDDPEVRENLAALLADQGYGVAAAVDGVAALALVEARSFAPDIVLCDYNLPGGLNGVQTALALRRALARPVPVAIVTGDIMVETLHDIALHDCVHFNKPVKIAELTKTIEGLLSAPTKPRDHGATLAGATIQIVDDDDGLRASLAALLEDEGAAVASFASCEAFLAADKPTGSACLLLDAYLPGMSGLQLLQKLHDDGRPLPVIMITGNSDVPMAIQAMKAGASDFIEKPVGAAELIAGIQRALAHAQDSNKAVEWRESAAAHLSGLTPRQRDVMERVLAGDPSKNIAADLGISQRTVENHRASIMRRTGSKSLPALARLALAAAGDSGRDPAKPRR